MLQLAIKCLSDMYKIMVKKVYFVGFRGGRSLPMDPSLVANPLQFGLRFNENLFLMIYLKTSFLTAPLSIVNGTLEFRGNPVWNHWYKHSKS